jgi:LuxR family maltose regulon positive regulatory protein
MPSQMHLVAATRYDPPLALARLRARRQLVEFRVDDLRFSMTETASLLNAQLRMELSSEQIQVLHFHVEGWVTDQVSPLLAAQACLHVHPLLAWNVG